jgi:hypothetical protein
MELAFTNLLIIVAAGFAAPLALGFFPSVRLPSVVLEIVIFPAVSLVLLPRSSGAGAGHPVGDDLSVAAPGA